MQKETVSCGYVVKKEGGKRELVIKCRECENNFSMDDCTPGIILALQKEYKISSIILSDYIEKQYTGRALEIMNIIGGLCEELDRYTMRDGNRSDCKDCDASPKKIFPKLKNTLLLEPGNTYGEIILISKALMAKEGCISCRKATKEELSMLGIELLKLKSKVLLDAYGIVG